MKISPVRLNQHLSYDFNSGTSMRTFSPADEALKHHSVDENKDENVCLNVGMTNKT